MDRVRTWSSFRYADWPGHRPHLETKRRSGERVFGDEFPPAPHLDVFLVRGLVVAAGHVVQSVVGTDVVMLVVAQQTYSRDIGALSLPPHVEAAGAHLGEW